MAQLLSAVAPGTLVQLNENGSPVQFYVAAQNYEPGMNINRVLLVRMEADQGGAWNSTNVNTYANSTIDKWFNSTYKARLDSWIQTRIASTSFLYTPGNGDNTERALSRAVFALSLTELGLSFPSSNREGETLSISSILKIAYKNGVAANQWTRTPTTNSSSSALGVAYDGSITNTSATTTSVSYRPCFTLPGTLYVWDDGTVSQTPPPPSSITTPALIMQGNGIPVSWSAVDGSESYILQRKADSGDWTEVYTGGDLTFTDTAGSWSTVQYQVCGVFSGVNGAFAQSEAITVVPASALVISGTDGNLGTITNDIPYAISTDTGNQIALTRTVNGALVASLTVNSGFAYNIPVMDLPTGTGTIVITATVATDSDPVTATRTWTYTKAAQTFPGAGGVAQLTQNGQNVFPLTLAEAVKTIGGPWGGNLSTALDKLALAATYTATAVPKYTQVTVDLSTAQAGDTVNLPENGVMVPFYVGSVDYEPTLNTSGTRVLLVRKDVYQNGQWNNPDVNTYANSTIDTWFNGAYKALLDSAVQAEIGETTFYYTPGNGDNEVTTLTRAIFALSLTELDGSKPGEANVEGNSLPIAETLSVLSGSSASQWTRTIRSDSGYTNVAWRLFYNGNVVSNVCNASYGYRPCFTLPATFSATYYVDPNSGTVYPSQEYTNAGDFYDLWGNAIPTVKIETGSYTGTGTYGSSNPNKLTFGFEPKLVLVFAGSSLESFMIIPAFAGNPDGDGSSFIIGGSNTCQVYPVSKNVDGNSLNWWVSGITQPHIQFNHSGRTYTYIAFG